MLRNHGLQEQPAEAETVPAKVERLLQLPDIVEPFLAAGAIEEPPAVQPDQERARDRLLEPVGVPAPIAIPVLRPHEGPALARQPERVVAEDEEARRPI